MIKIQYKRIMIVGWMNPKYNAEGIAQGFEQNGFEVVRVAADESLPKDSGKFDYHMLEELISVLPYKDQDGKTVNEKYTLEQLDTIMKYQAARRIFRLKWIVDRVPNLDFILITQFDNQPDITEINIPIGYYATEVCDPMMPVGKNVDFFLYAYIGGLEKLSHIFPYYKQQWPIAELIPHAINEKLIPTDVKPLSERSIKLGFKGLLDFNIEDKNPLIRFIYADRKRYVNFLQNVYQDESKWNKIKRIFTKKKQKPLLVYERNTNWDDYNSFMNETVLSLNVPGIDGSINQRQYEALAFGCVLLQAYYPELTQLGFWGDPIKYPNKCNCLWFKNEEQLLANIDWALKHPEELQIIADRGRNWLIESKQTWQGRTKQILDILTNDSEEQKEFEKRLQWHKDQQKMIDELHRIKNNELYINGEFIDGTKISSN